jgi:endonuclease YncB( thermonuclease family)
LIGKPQPEQQQYAETVAASQAVQQEVFPTKSVNLITIPLPQASIEPAREMQNQAAFAAMLPAAESEPRKSANVKSNVNVKRFFVPAIFLIIAGALLAMLIGYARITQGGGQDEKEPTSLAEAALAPESQNSAVNNPVGENIIAGKVVDVAGGDTITVADASNVEYKIRLEGIDAPEPEQEFGTEAESNLFNLAFGKMVQVNLLKPGTDGFTVGRVMLDGNNVSLEQLKAGLARHDETIVFEESDNDLYAGGESAARSDGLGLWAAEDSLPPWEYSEKIVFKKARIRQPPINTAKLRKRRRITIRRRKLLSGKRAARPSAKQFSPKPLSNRNKRKRQHLPASCRRRKFQRLFSRFMNLSRFPNVNRRLSVRRLRRKPKSATKIPSPPNAAIAL